MEVSRRSFMRLSAAGALAAAFGCSDRDRPVPRTAEHGTFRTEMKTGTETTTICPFCGCGCGAIVTTANIGGSPKVVNIEGDPDHPVNRGALCSKGAALYQIPNRPDFAMADEPDGNGGRRLVYPLRRDAGATTWTEIDWTTAISEIAAAVQTCRDYSVGPEAAGRSFVTTDALSRTVNRCENIYSLGGAALDNEECYLLVKMLRALGLVYIEHQARI
jgi:formate dehydrogenase major subunit